MPCSVLTVAYPLALRMITATAPGTYKLSVLGVSYSLGALFCTLPTAACLLAVRMRTATAPRGDCARGGPRRRACASAAVPAVSSARPGSAEFWEQHGAVHDLGCVKRSAVTTAGSLDCCIAHAFELRLFSLFVVLRPRVDLGNTRICKNQAKNWPGPSVFFMQNLLYHVHVHTQVWEWRWRSQPWECSSDKHAKPPTLAHHDAQSCSIRGVALSRISRCRTAN